MRIQFIYCFDFRSLNLVKIEWFGCFVALDTCCWGLKATEIQAVMGKWKINLIETQIQNIYNSTTIVFDSHIYRHFLRQIQSSLEVVLGWTPENLIFKYMFSLVTDNHVDWVIHELLIWRRILTTFTNKLFDYMHCSPLVDHKSRCCLFSRKSPCRSLSFQFRIWSN